MSDTPRKIRADVGATAWLNAAIASSNDDARPALYRTLAVEFFARGIQFIGCNGHALFRTWAPYSDNGDLPAPHPEPDEPPDDQIVVSDVDKFALGFMRTLLSACEEYDDLEVGVEKAEETGEPALGEALTEYVLTLRAHGQTFAARIYEGEYPNWRALSFGLDDFERVDGMKIGTRLFGFVGKLKGVAGVDCAFRGEDQAIEIRSTHDGLPSVRGLLMPMRREAKTPADQTSHA